MLATLPSLSRRNKCKTSRLFDPDISFRFDRPRLFQRTGLDRRGRQEGARIGHQARARAVDDACSSRWQARKSRRDSAWSSSPPSRRSLIPLQSRSTKPAGCMSSKCATTPSRTRSFWDASGCSPMKTATAVRNEQDVSRSPFVADGRHLLRRRHFRRRSAQYLLLQRYQWRWRGRCEKVLFTGFSRRNVQGMMNSLQWGLDHRIYGTSSTTGGKVSRDRDESRFENALIFTTATSPSIRKRSKCRR